MKKLHLELDDLAVESFETSNADAGYGTVRGYVSLRCVTNYTCDPAANTCGQNATCGEYYTCYVSCGTDCAVQECGGGGGTGYTWCGSNCPDCATEPATFCTC